MREIWVAAISAALCGCVSSGCPKGEHEDSSSGECVIDNAIAAVNQTGSYWACHDMSCTGFEPACIGCSFEIGFYGDTGATSGSGVIHRKTDQFGGANCMTSLEQTTWKEGSSVDGISVTTPEGLVLVNMIYFENESRWDASYTDGGTISAQCNLATGQPQ